MAIPRKPKLLYQVEITRKPYIRRFIWSLIAGLASLGAFLILEYAFQPGDADPFLYEVGRTAVGLVTAIFFLRALINLGRGLLRQNETLRIYDQGLVLQRRKGELKYSWSNLSTYRESFQGIYLGKRKLLQWGAIKLTMFDDNRLSFNPRYGDLRLLAVPLRRIAARVTGIQIGRTLRDDEPIKLHPRLTIWPGGIEANKQEIPWSDVDVRLKKNRLTVLRKGKNGKFVPVKHFNTRSIDNVGGFMEVATTTIRNNQRERFGV